MPVNLVTINDINSWIALAQEVESLFGPMVADQNFLSAMRQIIAEKNAFCIRSDEKGEPRPLCGIIAISPENNEITWFAVASQERGKGYGSKLLTYALTQLDPNRPIIVQTFAKEVEAGAGARNLYLQAGFIDAEDAGMNPAGIPTVIMKREIQQRM